MGWINIQKLKERCEDFIEKNPRMKFSKIVQRNGTFVFYREYTNPNKDKYEIADMRICLVRDDNGAEGWSVDYMRHNGKWQNMSIFGDFGHCLDEIRSGKWGLLNP